MVTRHHDVAPRSASVSLARLPQSLMLLGLLLALGVVSLVWNVLALLLHPLLPAERGLTLGRRVISDVYRHFWGVAGATGMLRFDGTALDVLKDERGLLIVANHPCVLDALLIVGRLPRSACLMKASLMVNPMLGPGARLARYIRNDTVVGTIRACVKDLKRGGQLVMFPEGTRTTRFPVNEFRPGVTLIAKLAKAPIQTVFIDTDSPFAGKGWPLWKLPPLPVTITMRLGERFAPERDEDALHQTLERYFADNVRTNVVANLERAQAWAKARS
jgi:1-acyl-sn-glycerol-3-phosphate acyltransferase